MRDRNYLPAGRVEPIMEKRLKRFDLLRREPGSKGGMYMGYILRSARGRKQGLTIPLRTKVFLIGSSPRSQIRSRRPGVGRRHCAFVLRKRKLYLQDLES